MVKCETQKSKVINILGRREYFSLGVRHDRPLGPACSEAHASTTKTLGELKMQTGIHSTVAYQPPASSTFLSEKPATSNQPAVLFSQKKLAPATGQTNALSVPKDSNTRWLPSKKIENLKKILYGSFFRADTAPSRERAWQTTAGMSWRRGRWASCSCDNSGRRGSGLAGARSCRRRRGGSAFTATPEPSVSSLPGSSCSSRPTAGPGSPRSAGSSSRSSSGSDAGAIRCIPVATWRCRHRRPKPAAPARELLAAPSQLRQRSGPHLRDMPVAIRSSSFLGRRGICS
jgi:hypothetical protein